MIENKNTNENCEFFLIHGYTSNVSDFSNLPKILENTFNIKVQAILLPGHDGVVEDLYNFKLEDYIKYAEEEFVKRRSSGKKIVLVGISFGAQLSMYLASKYEVAGVISISMVHKFKWPLNLPGIGLLGLVKKKWKKRFSAKEKEFSKERIAYEYMPSMGFFMNKKLSKTIEKKARYIRAPILSIYSTGENLADYRAINNLYKKISSSKKDTYLIDHETHSLFFSPHKDEIISVIVSFIKDNSLFDSFYLKENKLEKVTAIVPAYNEGSRIVKVLDALVRSSMIDEILVIDDGSSDDTGPVVLNFLRNFNQVKYIRNEKNKGKAFGMDRGVKLAKNDAIFFCDADLIGFTTEYAEDIIRPVLENRSDMFIGIRSNFMQRAVRLWALNSGERAMRKDIWYNLPEYYKHRYRIEAGLNYYVSKYSQKGMDWKILGYSQPIKESKYGFLRGDIIKMVDEF